MSYPAHPQWNDDQYPPTSAQYPRSPEYPPQSPAPLPTPGGYVMQPPTTHVVVTRHPTSGIAVASMVLGIVGLLSSCCSFGIPSILAVIFGHVGMRDTANGLKEGRGMAVAGLVMGYVVAAPAIALSIWIVIMGGIGAVSGIDPGPTPTP